MNYQTTMNILFGITNVKLIDDKFINSTGLLIIKETKLTNEANTLFNLLNLTSESDYELSGEFNSRLTYLNFQNAADGSIKNNTLIDKVINKYHHLSVCGDWVITFLIVGVSDEILKELVAHHEANISRLTSSNTKMQNQTYYRIDGTPGQQEEQKKYINQMLEYYNSIDRNILGTEFSNQLNLPCKVSACTFTMSLKDYHKLFIGRIKQSGNENQIREICLKMATILHEKFPLIIKDVESYNLSDNSEKMA